MALSGDLTGGEPKNYVDAQMQKTQVDPYSIRIGDKWYDYSRWEPFAFPLKIMANATVQIRRAQEDQANGNVEHWNEETIGILSYIFAEAVGSNSFMEGMESLLKVTGGSFEDDKAVSRVANTFVESYVPNIIRKVNQGFDDSGMKYTADPLSWDSLKRHFSSFLDMSDLDLDRNRFTGEVKFHGEEEDLRGHTNFSGRTIEEDKAMGLLVEANRHTGSQFTLKRPTGFIPGVDLRQVDGKNGRSLYDNYLELMSTVRVDGVTYREALEALADDPLFNELPWGNNTIKGSKVAEISSIKTTFEREAMKQLRLTESGFDWLLFKRDNDERVQLGSELEVARDYFNQ